MVRKADGTAGRRLGKFGLVAATAWLLLVTVYMIWGAALGRGLYGWLTSLQAPIGGYSSTYTFAIPYLLLAMPSIWLLFGHLAAIGREISGNPALELRYERQWAFALLGLAGLSLLAGLGSLAMAMRAPDEAQPSVPITLSQIEQDAIPDRRIRLVGRLDPQASLAVVERQRFASRNTLSFTAFRPVTEDQSKAENDPDAPLRIFVEGRMDADPSATPIDPIQVQGFLVRNALPDFARNSIRKRGIKLAEPHFVLRQTSSRSSWLTGMALGLFFSFVLGLIGSLLLIRTLIGGRP